jgi:hypothetical protein
MRWPRIECISGQLDRLAVLERCTFEMQAVGRAWRVGSAGEGLSILRLVEVADYSMQPTSAFGFTILAGFQD